MSIFKFYTSPGFTVAKRAVAGFAVSTAALAILVGGIHFVLAQQDAAPPQDGVINPPPVEQPRPPEQRDDRADQPRPPEMQPPQQPQQPQQPPQQPQDQNGMPGGPGPGGQNFGGQGQGPGGNQGQGMSEEQQKKMEEQQKAQDEKNFKRMKQGVKQMSSMLKRITSRIASMKKAGIEVPDNLLASLDAVTKDAALILSAQSMSDAGVEDAMNDLQDSGNTLQDGMASLERLSQAAAMIKQAASQVKRLDTSLARVQKIAKTSKVDVSSQADKFAQAVSDIKAAVQKAQDALASGDGETAMQILQDDVYDKLQDAFQYETIVRALQSMQSNITRFSSFITKMQKTIAKMEKAGSDVGDAPAQLDQMKADLEKLKQLITQADVDPVDLGDLMNSLLDSQNSILESLGQPSSNAPSFSANPNDSKDFQNFQNYSLPSFGGAPGGQQPMQPRQSPGVMLPQGGGQ